MAITQRTAVETQVTPAATNITVTKPTGLADNDYVVISLALNGGSLSAAPAGFTLIASELTQSNPKLYVYGKYITSAVGEGAWTFTATSVVKTAIAQAFIGVDATTQIDVAAVKGTNSTGSNVMTVAGVTTVTADAVLIYIAAINSASNVITAPAGMTVVLETTGTKKQEMDYELRATAGATGSRAGAAASSVLAWAAMLFALRPASGAAVTFTSPTAALTLAPLTPAFTSATTYSGVIQSTPGLTGYWRLGEASGTSAVDASGGGNNLTYTGTPGLATASLLASDPSDTAVDFNGSSQYAVSSGAVPAGWQGGTAITLECWVNGDTTGNKSPMALFGSGTDKGLWLNFSSPLSAWASLDGSAQTLVQDSAATTTGTIYHFAVTFDGANLRLYVNGSNVATTPLVGTIHPVTTSAAFAIGRLGALSSDYFDGRVDEAAVYNRTLTATDIAAHYTIGSTAAGATYTSPVASLTLAPLTPTIGVALTSPVRTLTLSALTPSATAVVAVTSPVASLTLAALTPSFSVGVTFTSPLATLTLTPQTPSASAVVSVVTPLAALTLTPRTPTIGVSLTSPVQAITLAAQTPSFSAGAIATSPLQSLTLAALTPAFTAAAIFTSPLASLTLTGLTPSASAAVAVTSPVAALTVTPLTPSVAAGVAYTSPVASISLTAFTPSVSVGVAVTSPVAALTLTGLTPAFSTATTYTSPLATLTLAAQAPTFTAAAVATTPVAAITLTALTPAFSTAITFTSPVAALSLSPQTPAYTAAAIYVSPKQALTLSALTPAFASAVVATSPVVALALAGLTPSFRADVAFTSPTAALALNLMTPSVAVGAVTILPVAALTLLGLTPSFTFAGPLGIFYPLTATVALTSRLSAAVTAQSLSGTAAISSPLRASVALHNVDATVRLTSLLSAIVEGSPS